MKLNGNTSKRSAAARREAADFAAQERSAHRSGANRSAQSEAAARRAAAPKQAAAQRPPVPRQEQPARRGAISGWRSGQRFLSVPRRSRTLGRQRPRRPAARRNERSISWCFPSFAAAAAAAILVTWRRYLSCDKISVAFRRWLVNSGAALAAEIYRLRSKNRPGSICSRGGGCFGGNYSPK